MTAGVAGLTMYSAIAKAKLRPGDWLAIPGAGGGLGHLYVSSESAKAATFAYHANGSGRKEVFRLP